MSGDYNTPKSYRDDPNFLDKLFNALGSERDTIFDDKRMALRLSSTYKELGLDIDVNDLSSYIKDNLEKLQGKTIMTRDSEKTLVRVREYPTAFKLVSPKPITQIKK